MPEAIQKVSRVQAWISERRELWLNSIFDLPLVVVFAVFAIGIGTEELLRVSPLYPLGALALLIVVGVWKRRRITSQTTWLLMLFGVGLLGFSMHAIQLDTDRRDTTIAMSTKEWSPVVFRGVIDGVPRWRPDVLQYEARLDDKNAPAALSEWNTILEVRLDEVRDRQSWKRAEGRLTVTVDGSIRNLLPGDRVQFFAKWQRIPVPTNPGQFNVAEYYRRKGQGVRARCESAEQVQKLSVSTRLRLDRYLGWMMERGDAAIHRYVSPTRATLASALILGQREQVEWELQESLLATGTMHMLAISGMHVEMVAISLVSFALLIRLPRKTTLLLTAFTVICYGVICGGQPPVMRAVVLVVAVCFAKWIGRTSNALNMLALAGLLLLLARTSNLFDIGTQLSFLAVAMLSLLSTHRDISLREQDPLDQLIYESRPLWQRFLIDSRAIAIEMLRTSSWVWFITTPLVLSAFHVIAPIAILLNLVLWLPLLLALLSGLGVVVLGTWIPPLGLFLGWVCDWNLAIIQFVIEWSEKIPFSHFWLPAPPLTWTLLFYLLLIGVWSILGFARIRRKLAFAILGGWFVVGIVPWLVPKEWFREQQRRDLQLTIIDVGHGECVLIRTPDSKNYLYDAGRMGDAERSFQSIAGVLWYEGIARLDGIFLSHADSDHYNALQGIAKRFWVKRLSTTTQVVSHRSPQLQRILEKLSAREVRLDIWGVGGTEVIGSTKLHALHPPPEGVSGNDNANSLCLEIEYAGRKVLLTGDLEGAGTAALLKQPSRKVDVLLAPHHGSVSQNPRPLLQWCTPRYTVISGGPRASSSKVQAAYKQANNATLITHRDGAIRVTITDDGRISAQHWVFPGWQEYSKE